MGLPIEGALPRIVQTLREGNIVLVAPPGAGKTTLLPPALLSEGLCDDGELWVLQPRRLAARLAAERVASLLGEPVGQRCGYQVRFESKVSDATRIRFVTHGLLVRRLREDPELEGITTVLLDEFHERRLDADLALALLRRLQKRRPELRIGVMSATIQPDPLADYLDAPVERVEGRAFPVELEYFGEGDRPLESRVARAFRTLVEHGIDGHVLVFLPGAREIRACEESCRGPASAAGFEVHVLHGEGSRKSQQAAVSPSQTPKLILSTNVAETSITIEGVAAVIDSGQARVASHDTWSGVAKLELSSISRASADQRAGRAGRTREGQCIRLYSRHDFERRPAHDAPELRRLDLSGPLLDLLVGGVEEPTSFKWFEPPPADSLKAAAALLFELDAVEDDSLTDTGRRMARFPVSPRVARLMVEAERRGVATMGAGAAALLSERPLQRQRRPADEDADADILVELGWLDQLRTDDDLARRKGIDPATAHRVSQLHRSLSNLVDRSAPAPAGRQAREDALRMSVLAGFSDRVARIRDDGPDRRTLVLCRGGSALQSPSSVVRSAQWAVGLTVEERREGGRRPQSFVRSVCAIEPDWLIDMFADRIVEQRKLHFDTQRERVLGREELRYGQLVIESTDLRKLPPEASEVLAEAALSAGPARFVKDPEALEQLLLRTRFAHSLDPSIAVLDEQRVRETLAEMCEGRSSFAQLRDAGLLAHLRMHLGAGAPTLDRLTPTHIKLPGGRRCPVHYETDRDPWIASRLQDFFGMSDGPRLGERTPLVLHLRAPNNRDVQVTTDLAGFWERHYPELRRTLMRRYPKHDWPEDPLTAKPPAPRGPRKR